ncbi:MAG: hypothetical protein DRJ65_10430 [Acidobacteria bacterium]|nr:MAG: hypothetical protein DRJ65_10430 [Acidobacteriota bacterium]
MDRLQQERWLVALVAFHSAVVGVVLLTVPRWAASFGGWGELDTLFFVRQGGIFHVVVAAGYLMEYFRHRTVGLLLTAKTLATVFLILSWLADLSGAWALPFAALGDGLMAVMVLLAHRRAGRIS